MKQAIIFAVHLAMMAVVASAAGPEVVEQALDGFELKVPAPGANALADEVLQQAIDKVASQGGGVVLLGAGDFKLSRKAGEETVVIKSNVTLRGQGRATHIYLDPETPPHEERYYPMRIGTASEPAHHVVIENLRYTGNDQAIGGGSIMGFNARLDDSKSLLLSCDNVTVRNCWICDTKQAAGCTKAAGHYPDADRQAAQFKNWQVHHNYIDTCGNKAVELAECHGGLIADNHIVNAADGPQVIFGSRNVQIRDNVVYFNATGINVTEGSHHIRVSGNHVEPMPEIKPGVAAPCLVFRTEPQPLHTRIHDVVVSGNVFRNQTTRSKCTLRFMTRNEALSCVYEGISITGNVFDGDVQILDKTTPAHTTIRDILFADNVCEGSILSEPDSLVKSNHVVVRGNMLRGADSIRLNASQWIWSGNTHVNGTLEVAAGAKANLVRDNVTAAPILDHGTDTDLTGNVVMKKTKTP